MKLKLTRKSLLCTLGECTAAVHPDKHLHFPRDFIDKSVKRLAFARNRTQDSRLEQPVVCHWAVTTGQPAALTILHMYYTGGSYWNISVAHPAFVVALYFAVVSDLSLSYQVVMFYLLGYTILSTFTVQVPSVTLAQAHPSKSASAFYYPLSQPTWHFC